MCKEITPQELELLPEAERLIIDIRDRVSFEYGHIPGAVNIPQNELVPDKLPADRLAVICCKVGQLSREAAEVLSESGVNAVSLAGGYLEWLRINIEKRDITADVELSIRKKFKKSIWCKHRLNR